MRILLLTHAFNSLTQALAAELQRHGHEISIEFDIADSVAEEAVALFRPDLIVAPYLRRAIPESIWKRHVCLVVHPGIVGDRGPSALDWAIQTGEAEWGVTVLQAEAEMDAGPVWASAVFPLRAAKKSSIYRNEVTQAATTAVLQAVERFAAGDFVPTPLADCSDVRGSLRPLMRQADRAIDWQRNDTATVLKKINAADGFPGVADSLFGQACHIFDAWPESALGGSDRRQTGRTHGAARNCRAAQDPRWRGLDRPCQTPGQHQAAGHAGLCRRSGGAAGIAAGKLVAGRPRDLAGHRLRRIRRVSVSCISSSTTAPCPPAQCERLRAALAWAKQRPVKVLVLLGGADFWSNGIHLNVIEAASLD